MKFFHFRDFRLMILLPSVLLAFVVLLFVVQRSLSYMEKQTDVIIEGIGSKRGEAIASFIEHYFVQIEQANYYMSKIPFVRGSFEHFEHYRNSRDAGERLSDAMKDFRRNSPREFNYDYQFTLSHGVTLLRTRDNSIGRYREDYELAAIETLKGKEAITGFELSNETIYLKSVVPLMQKDSLLGISEVQLSIEEIIIAFERETGLQTAFLLDKDNLPSDLPAQLNFMRRWANEKESLFRFGGKRLKVDGKVLYDIASQQSSKKYWVSRIDDQVYEFFEIRDVMGTRIGYWLAVHELTPVVTQKEKLERGLVIVLPLMLLVFALTLYLILTHLISRPLKRVAARMEAYSKGDFAKEYYVGTSEELNRLNDWMKRLAEQTEQITGFAEELGQGNLKAKYEVFGEEDYLGGALVEMRDRLVLAEQDANARFEVEKKEKWITDGVAQMGDILRQQSDDIEKLNDAVVTFLANYIGVVQGAVYVVEREDDNTEYLRLSAAYAYEQKKYMNLKIKFGEGLIGTCAAEKDKIYLENIPADHVQITSGLGGGSPSFVFLFPLIMNEQLFGVVELSNFEKVEEYRIGFAEKVAGSYAATLANVKINARTKLLLDQYKQQQEELQKHEEKMRENMERMLATQEEALLRERTVASLIESIDVSIIRLELSVEGMVLTTNDFFLNLTEQLEEGVVGKHFESFVDVESRTDVKKAWKAVQQLRPYNCHVNLMDKFSQKIALVAVFSPIIDENGELRKTHFLAQKA